jgi:hypothetical protein
MPQFVIDIPDTLFASIANSSQSSGVPFDQTILKLIELGITAISFDSEEQAQADAFLGLLIARAAKQKHGDPFTTKDLASAGEWASHKASVRKVMGKHFSKSVREGLVKGVKNTGRKTAQNKNIYVRA